MSKKKKTNPKGTKVTKAVEFLLTEKDYAEKGKEAAALEKQIQTLEVQFEEAKEEWRAKIKAREAKRSELLNVIAAEKESRTVDTLMVKNFDAKLVEFYYDGEVVESRPMTPEELQIELDLRAPKPIKKGRSKKAAGTVQTGEQVAHTDDERSAEIAEVRKLETGRATKTSAVDGPAVATATH